MSALSLVALGHVALALAATALAPTWLLLLAPLLLGVPHVASDVRCLLVRPPGGSPGRLPAVAIVPLLALTVGRIVAVAGGPFSAALEVALGVAAIAAGIGLAPAPAPARALALAGLALVGLAAVGQPATTTLALAHGHNLVALGVLVAWWPRGQSGRLLPGLAVLGGLVLILAGGLDAVTAGAAPATTLDLERLAPTFAPPDADPLVARRLTLAFAFGQAVHYSAWLHLIPTARLGGEAPRGLRASLDRVHGDLGTFGVGVFAVSAAITLGLAALAPERTRSGYLAVVVGHGWLELAALGRLALTTCRP